MRVAGFLGTRCGVSCTCGSVRCTRSGVSCTSWGEETAQKEVHAGAQVVQAVAKGKSADLRKNMYNFEKKYILRRNPSVTSQYEFD